MPKINKFKLIWNDGVLKLTFACPDVSTMNKPIKVNGILYELEVFLILQVLRCGRCCFV
jgi:hypothetical protein